MFPKYQNENPTDLHSESNYQDIIPITSNFDIRNLNFLAPQPIMFIVKNSKY